MWVVLLGLHEHGKVHRKEKLTQVKVSSVFQLRERNPLVLGLQNFSQPTWASAIPLAKGPAPSYSRVHRHKALALVPFKAPKLCLRPKATFPKVGQAQSCYWGLSQAVSRLFSTTVTSQISENVIKMKSSGRQLRWSDAWAGSKITFGQRYSYRY